jgi:hypothetical protein
MTLNKPAPELVAQYRLAERRLRVAYRALKPAWSYRGRMFGQALVARDVLAVIRFERRAARGPLASMLALWQPQIDALCRAAVKGGSCHAQL